MTKCLWTVICAIIAAAPASATITYHITARVALTPPLVQVDMSFKLPRAECIKLEAPAWSPGDYQLQHFGKYILSLSATTGSGLPLKVSRGRLPDEWRIACGNPGMVHVQYFVPNEPPGNFSQNVQLTKNLLFINGPAALLYVRGRKEESCQLTVTIPSGWQVSSDLPSQGGEHLHRLHAADYDQLADAPLVAAPRLLIYHFTDHGCRYSLVFYHHLASLQNPARWVSVFHRIAHAENDLMQITPYTHYHFLLDVGGGLGGLEHLNSCRLAYYPGLNASQYAPFVAHELFHSWNVKRLRPAVLGPFNYQQPAKTRCLWFAEGVTEYFAWIACRRAGLISVPQFESHFRGLIARYIANPARNRVSADTASLMVWSTRSSNGYQGVSYYDQGELIALCMDLTIRHLTDQQQDLASLMRLMYNQYAIPKPGYHLNDIATALQVVTGKSLTRWFMQLADSTAQLPLQECLSYAGLDNNLTPIQASSKETDLRTAWQR